MGPAVARPPVLLIPGVFRPADVTGRMTSPRLNVDSRGKRMAMPRSPCGPDWYWYRSGSRAMTLVLALMGRFVAGEHHVSTPVVGSGGDGVG
jgi:hypothetical protein